MNVQSLRASLAAELTKVLREYWEEMVSEEEARSHRKIQPVVFDPRGRFSIIPLVERWEILSDCYREVKSSPSQEAGKEPVAAGK